MIDFAPVILQSQEDRRDQKDSNYFMSELSKHILHNVSKHALDNEQELVAVLLRTTSAYSNKASAIRTRAEGYINVIRENSSNHGVEAIVHQFGLQNHEGITLMALAEALLRIPDTHTANALIHDKFKHTEWKHYLNKDNSLFNNASTWGLILSENVLNFGEGEKENRIRQFISRLGEPVVREALKKAMMLLGSQFVLASTIAQATKKSGSYEKKGFLFSYDMLGEGARSEAQAEHFFAAYMEAIKAIAGQKAHSSANAQHIPPLFQRPGISVKLSALHPRYELLQRESVMERLLPRIKALTEEAMRHNISLSIDAEEARRLDLSLELFSFLRTDPTFKGYNGIGFVLQAYQKRAIYVLDALEELANEQQCVIPVRLVKGAYWDSEIKAAQMEGLSDYPVFTQKHHTDISYLACAQFLLKKPECFYPQFATHNAVTVSSIVQIADKQPFEFQKLYGMGNALYEHIVMEYPCRIYAPVGQYDELLPYLIRRLLENGANSSFVNHVMDKEYPLERLTANPLEQDIAKSSLPLPENIYGNKRKNSTGCDLGNQNQLDILSKSLSEYNGTIWDAFPLVNGKNVEDSKAQKVIYPHNNKKLVGKVSTSSKQSIKQAMLSAGQAFTRWNNTPVRERADILRAIAAAYDSHQTELIALCMKEAGKTLHDAIAEVREAIDFCRYYASLAEEQFIPSPLPGYTGESNHLRLEGRGVFVCISPWNFPLAIFTGQIVAALVCGNSVVAKPAEQTPLVAYRAIQLMHEAGVPGDVLHFLPGKGERVGKRLIEHPLTAGVVFTGSNDTARHINISLAKRSGAILPFIAETGGQNAMIIDSSALLEQAVDDVIHSAFGSAGQRCSALRVLYIQDDIAERFITLLADAMQELYVGNPEVFSTDIGPVIDTDAQDRLHKHIQSMKRNYHLIAHAPDHKEIEKGTFVLPHAFEIPHIHCLKQEIFGPVLHVIRFEAEALDQVINDINSTGYGLTFGLHSRIQERASYMNKAIQAGNIYINRGITGAVVGTQPFGGMGLSGTGFKAGGTHYLLRFAQEKTYTVNTTAIGGNIELLS